MSKSLRSLPGTLATLLLALPGPAQAAPIRPVFDHLTTGFELTGAHRTVPCESCHVDAVFKGTPRECVGCHSPGNRIRSTSKPATHVVSSENCGQCHSTSAYVPAAHFDHHEVQGSCATCHNGVQAEGMPPGHLQTSLNCDSCHRTSAWQPALFDHSRVMAGTCIQCHDGVSATGKNPQHIASTANCDACHVTSAWSPVARVDHAEVQGACAGCHDGTAATGKHPTHIQTTLECDGCHTTAAWVPARATAAPVRTAARARAT